MISANLHRRHLSDQERSKIAVELVKAIKQEQDAEKSAAKEEHDLGQPNSGNMFPLSGQSSSDIPLPPAWVRGRGKKGPAAIAAAQTGLSKQAVNKAVARATLKDSQILKVIDCLRFEDLRFEPTQ